MRIPLVTALILVFLSILVDWAIYSEIKRYSSRARKWGRVYAVSALLCYIYLGVVLLMPRRNPEANILPIMWCLYGYITVYGSKFIYAVFSRIGMLPLVFRWKIFHKDIFGDWRSRKLRRFKSGLWFGLPAALVAFFLMWWGALWGRKQLEVREVEFYSPKLPEAFEGYRIAQFSDAHVGTWGNDTAFISRLVDSINALKPDMIVFTGDIVNRQTNEVLPFIPVLSRLSAPDGVYSVLGNHDYGDYCDWDTPEAREANNALLLEIQRQMGWRTLNNDRVFISRPGAPADTLVLIGVENWGDPPFKQYGRLEDAYSMSTDSVMHLNDERFKILLTHDPDHWRKEVSKHTNIDLTLSGHTHAMQMMLEAGDWRWSPAKWRYEEWAGMFEKKNEQGVPVRGYVNIGCGEVGMPFRIGATPEITLFTLRRTPQEQ
ncbi:MAG: metallophosphoesterase [Muribaculaceae bacterium]|nr:metallophosphoesterase [Muribaculaceae bacterium]